MTWLAVRLFLRSGMAWATSPLGRVLLAILAALGLLWGSYALGQHNGVMAERGRWEARQAKAAADVAKHTATANTISAVAKVSHETRDAAIATHTRTLVEKVPEYVTAQDDRNCVVPDGISGLLNDAAAGTPTVPATASGPVEAAPAVPLSAVVTFAVENTGIGQQWREEALTWRQWYADQVKAWGK